MAYPDRAALIAASSIEELTGLTNDQQDALRTEAILAIEGHCGQSFLPEGDEDDPVTKTVDSAGGHSVRLPKRLASLSELAVSSSSLTAADVILDDNHARLVVPDRRSGGSWLTRVQAEMEWPGLAFPSGAESVSITGIWGWTDEEYTAQLSAVTTAIRYDMEDRALANAHRLSDSVRSAKALGLSAVSQGSLSFDLGGREADVSFRVARLLAGADLIWEANVGAVA